MLSIWQPRRRVIKETRRSPALSTAVLTTKLSTAEYQLVCLVAGSKDIHVNTEFHTILLFHIWDFHDDNSSVTMLYVTVNNITLITVIWEINNC